MLIYSVTLGDNGTLWIKAINEVNKGDIQVKLRFSSSPMRFPETKDFQ